jgi:hypothetical protein
LLVPLGHLGVDLGRVDLVDFLVTASLPGL